MLKSCICQFEKIDKSQMHCWGAGEPGGETFYREPEPELIKNYM